LFWRAQQAHEFRPIDSQFPEDGDFPCACSPNRMKPLIGSASEGRANPKGLPYLYVADDRDTAMAEVRPWVGAYISVAQLRMIRDTKIIVCSKPRQKHSLHLTDPPETEWDRLVWEDIDDAFSTPISVTDRTADYVPTQVLAEFFRTNGYDGIAYKSSLGEGHNIAFFDTSIAEVINCQLCEAKSVKFGFSELDQYVVASERE
jgi:hypothetical protein